MKINIVTTAMAIFCILSCSRQQPKKLLADNSINDTILYADSTNLYSGVPKRLTTAVAKKVLENYYRPKGFYAEGMLSLDSLLTTNSDGSLRCFNFFDLRKINLKNRKYPLGIVRYYKGGCFENGNHVRPHSAMITADKNGNYILVNEDFLADYYFIDNISGNDGNLKIKDSILDRANPPAATPYTARIILK